MQTDYIPRKDGAFFNFQRSLISTVQPNLAAWNISATAFNKVLAAQTPYETAYKKITSRKTRTSVQVKEHRQQRNSYTRAIRTFVREQLAGNTSVSDSDRKGFRMKLLDSKKSRRSKIDTEPTVSIGTMNGAWMRITCRVEHDNSRPSMHPLADAIEIKFIIGLTAPISPDECNQTYISTKAKFILRQHIADAGKKIFGYARYKNIRNDEKSGPWSLLFRCMIAD
jgi:hypothetical protein